MADNFDVSGSTSSLNTSLSETTETSAKSASYQTQSVVSDITVDYLARSKVSSGTRKSTIKAPTALERRLEQELPQNVVCVMDCEAAEILQHIQDKMVRLSQCPDVKLPGWFDMGLMYAKSDGNQVKSETVKRILQPLKEHGVSDCEICLIANILPESEEEVFALIPALKSNMKMVKDPLKVASSELTHLKESLATLKDSS